MILWVMQWQMPRTVAAWMVMSKPDAGATPVPVEFRAELDFAEGVSAGFYCSFTAAMQQWVTIAGTLGQLRIPDFVLPFRGDQLGFETSRCAIATRQSVPEVTVAVRQHFVPERSNNHPSAQEARMFRAFSSQVLAGGWDGFWPEISRKTQQVLETCYATAKAASATDP